MLAWAALALLANAPMNRRHIRQRYCALSLDWAERLVRSLAIIRAVEIAAIRKRQRPPLRNAASQGFRRRIERAAVGRAIAGSRLRKALKHRDIAQRLQRLIAALADVDAFARRYLVTRARRRLTRLHAVIVYAPSADAFTASPQPAPCAADTS